MSNVTYIGTSWRKALVYGKENRLRSDVGNAFLLLSNGEWKNRLGYDAFGDRYYWTQDGIPLQSFDTPKKGDDVSDGHMVYLQHYFSAIGGQGHSQGIPTVQFKSSTLFEAVMAAARRHTVHPLRDYLRGLKWDGVSRIDRFCHECLGTEDSKYTASVGRWWLISAVARAIDPGCQADYMLVLISDQGDRKSTALQVLAGDWYLPTIPDVRNKDAAHVMQGRWICEYGELNDKRKDNDALKDFITRRADIFRLPYGKAVVRRPRTIVFAATTNNRTPLSDPTGARRFWPVMCGAINIKLLTEWRDQLWAESVRLFDAGEQYWPTAEMAEPVAANQEKVYSEDPWEQRVIMWAGKQSEPFKMHDVLAMPLDLTPEKWTHAAATRVGAILNRNGYVSRRVRDGDSRHRVYERIFTVDAP